MNKEMPSVSIIIPCRNEEKFIGKCLDSIISQDYPKEKMEVLIVDGMSEDGTRAIIKNYSEKYPFIKLLDNPDKFTSFALNIGIKNSGGEIIARMDAHAGYEKDYISKCVKYLKEYDADNIGGTMKTLPTRDTIIAKAIAICLSHPFGAASSFRLGFQKPKGGEESKLSSSPFAAAREVDTVFNGCYKKEVFDKVGLFNENLIRSQDMEFNLRLKRAGGRILLHPEIVSYYYPKSKLKDFFLHNVNDGVWAVLPLKFVKIPLKLRHYIPLAFVLTLPLNIWFYIMVSLVFSGQIAIREKDIKLFFTMPIVFFCRHIGYGLGSIFGLFELFFSKK